MTQHDDGIGAHALRLVNVERVAHREVDAERPEVAAGDVGGAYALDVGAGSRAERQNAIALADDVLESLRPLAHPGELSPLEWTVMTLVHALQAGGMRA